MAKNKKRIDLLSASEIEDLYLRPKFNDEERQLYFALDEKESVAAAYYSNERTRLYFILQLGYFKAKQQFFSYATHLLTNSIHRFHNSYSFSNFEPSGSAGSPA